MTYILAYICGLLFAIVCLLSFLLYRSKKRPPKKLSTTAEELLHEFTRNGSAVLRVQVIDQEQIFLRSPR